MPSIKSSSKGDTKLTLFAAEQRALANAAKTLRWISQHHDGDKQLVEDANRAAGSIQIVLSRLVNGETKPAAK
jgi:hypothetical protein